MVHKRWVDGTVHYIQVDNLFDWMNCYQFKLSIFKKNDKCHLVSLLVVIVLDFNIVIVGICTFPSHSN